MIVFDKTLDDFRANIAPLAATWRDIVVPRNVEILPNFKYSPVYAWMYSYEKQLKYRIEEASGRPLGTVETLLFGADGVLSEAISNAFVHGNARRTDLPIEVVTLVGKGGMAFSIRDRGEGFDLNRTITAVARGGAYFKYAGNGLRALSDRDGVVAAYAEEGRVLNLHVLWSGATSSDAP